MNRYTIKSLEEHSRDSLVLRLRKFFGHYRIRKMKNLANMLKKKNFLELKYGNNLLEHLLFSSGLGKYDDDHECILRFENAADNLFGWKFGLQMVVEDQLYDLIDYMVHRNQNNWNYVFQSACTVGDRYLIRKMIERGADDWEKGFQNACEGNQLSIVKEMIERGACDLRNGLGLACNARNYEICDYLVEQGADSCHYCFFESKCTPSTRPILHKIDYYG